MTKKLFLLTVIVVFFIFFQKAHAQEITYSPVPPQDLTCKAPPMCFVPDEESNSVKSAGSEATSTGSEFCLSVPVLLYHHIEPQADAKTKGQTSLNVDPEFFDMQMKYLKDNGYNTIRADSLINALSSHSQLPGKSILVTMDDGYKDNYTYAFPIVQKYGITVNFALATGLAGGADFMNWGDLSALKSSGLYYFMDHTWSHYSVTGGNRNKIEQEIMTGKSQIESNLGQTTNVFVYPYGGSGATAIVVLKDNGFIGAFSTIPGFLQCDSYIMNLHRNHVGNAPLSSYGL